MTIFLSNLSVSVFLKPNPCSLSHPELTDELAGIWRGQALPQFPNPRRSERLSSFAPFVHFLWFIEDLYLFKLRDTKAERLTPSLCTWCLHLSDPIPALDPMIYGFTKLGKAAMYKLSLFPFLLLFPFNFYFYFLYKFDFFFFFGIKMTNKIDPFMH